MHAPLPSSIFLDSAFLRKKDRGSIIHILSSWNLSLSLASLLQSSASLLQHAMMNFGSGLTCILKKIVEDMFTVCWRLLMWKYNPDPLLQQRVRTWTHRGRHAWTSLPTVPCPDTTWTANSFSQGPCWFYVSKEGKLHLTIPLPRLSWNCWGKYAEWLEGTSHAGDMVGS